MCIILTYLDCNDSKILFIITIQGPVVQKRVESA